MQSNRIRVAVGVALVAAAVALFIVLSGSEDDPSDGTSASASRGDSRAALQPPPAEIIRVRGGEPVGGVQELSAGSGAPVRFRVVSDLAGGVHVHGYDYEKPVRAGGSVSFDFPATLEGGFEIELHHGGGESLIAELRVQP